MVTFLVLVASFAASFVFASFFEWVLHKYFMHGVLNRGYPYRAHALVHHAVFSRGDRYYLQDKKDKSLVTMAWWNGPVLFLINLPIPATAAWLFDSVWVFVGSASAFAAYYVAYEYLHWCMHVPAKRWIEGTRFFKWIDIHHRVHHLHPMKNLNVVLPVADFLLRSRLAMPAEAATAGVR